MHSKCCFTTFSRIDVPAKQKVELGLESLILLQVCACAQLGQMCSSPNFMDQKYLSTCCTSICRSLRELEGYTHHSSPWICLDRLGNWQMLDSDRIGF